MPFCDTIGVGNCKNGSDRSFCECSGLDLCRWRIHCHFGQWLKEQWPLSWANILSIQMTHSLSFDPYKFTVLDLVLTFLCGYPSPYTLSKIIPPTTMIRNIKVGKGWGRSIESDGNCWSGQPASLIESINHSQSVLINLNVCESCFYSGDVGPFKIQISKRCESWWL